MYILHFNFKSRNVFVWYWYLIINILIEKGATNRLTNLITFNVSF